MAAFLPRSSSKAGLPADASERDRWIHRDKLTQIEIQEYRDLGLEPPAELLRRAAESRAQAASREQAAALRDIRSPSPYRYDENEEDELEAARRQSQRHRHQHHQQQQPSEDLSEYHSVGHTQHADADGDDDDDDSSSVFVPVDPRSPEEIAADPYEDGRMTPSLRKSNSKIPLAPYSPVPVPQEHLDRDHPLPRKRGASVGYDELAGSPGGLAYPRTRIRKGSSSSEGAADDEQPVASSPITGPLTPSSPNKRPPKNRTASGKSNASKKKPMGNQRSASNTPRARSNSNTPSRPGTSSGDRPRTANRSGPESDPPWLALMNQYKPDPRLPPDQQMLPTHAKRMMMEQMERENEPGQVYDQEFNAVQSFSNLDKEKLASDARTQAGEEIDRGTSPNMGDRSAGWPLSGDFGIRDPTPSPTKANGSPIKGSPGAGSGPGATPRMTDSPKPQIGLFPSPRIGGGEIPMPEPSPRQPSPRQSPLPPAPNMRAQAGAGAAPGRDEEKQEPVEEKKKGGCGCCVVM